MFKNILIVYSEKLTEKHLKTVEEVKKIVNQNSKTVNANTLNESLFTDVDLVITIGGDGTFIRAASFLKDTPILGINSEPEFSEGHLTSITEGELDFLNKVTKGDYKIIERQRAEVVLNNKKLDKPVLNEVYIGTLSQFHVSRYVIKLKEHEEEHRSSGVLVVTGSGSNAWYKSAGGKPFSYDEKKLKFRVRENFFSRIFNPEITEGEILENEKIEFDAKRYGGGIIALDGNWTYDFNISDKAEIKVSDTPLKVISK